MYGKVGNMDISEIEPKDAIEQLKRLRGVCLWEKDILAIDFAIEAIESQRKIKEENHGNKIQYNFNSKRQLRH